MLQSALINKNADLKKIHEHITIKWLFHTEKLVLIIEQDLSDKKKLQ